MIFCGIGAAVSFAPRAPRAGEDGRPQFQVLLAPDDEEIARLTASLAEGIKKLLLRRGLGPDSDPEESDPLCRDQPWLAGLYAAAVSGRVAFGPHAGRRVTRIGDQIDPESMDALASPRCASVSGFSLHANTSVPAGDRQRLEDLQPDYNQVGADRVAFNDDCACGASMARRKRNSVAELRR